MTKIKPRFNQAQKVVRRFGGTVKVAGLLGVSRQTVYRWMCPRPLGSDGIIPSSKVPELIDLARVHGVDLSDVDWAPESTDHIDELLS